MNLAKLLACVQLRNDAPPREILSSIEVAEIREDSRQVRAGDLFVAVRGQTADGHRFLQAASAAGAQAALVEQIQTDCPLLQIPVHNAAAALAQIAANRHDRPAESLNLIGITGTNGKTTSNFLVEAMLQKAGLSPGLLGTVVYRAPGFERPAPYTTPTPLLLHETLAAMRSAGARWVTMEVSSHGLFLQRLAGVRFRVAAFTNLTQDHLDLHGTMEAYFAAKLCLFTEHLLPADQGGRAVVNLDDPWGERLYALLPADQRLGFSQTRPADVSVVQATVGVSGISAVLQTPVGEVQVRSPLLGGFNLANLMLAASVGAALGLPAETLGQGLSQVSGVPGRLERVPSEQGPTVLVDYAHTPDALHRVLGTLRALGGSGRLFVVFGCGGDRDAGKRALMGQVAAQQADIVVVTSDNPRSEDPGHIIDAVLVGVKDVGRLPLLHRAAEAQDADRGFFVEPDRRQAITQAIGAARPGDLVLLAGKGHEGYLITGSHRTHFDDREEARAALAQRRPTSPAWAHEAQTAKTRTGETSTGETSTEERPGPSVELPLDRVLAATGGRVVEPGAQHFSAVTIDSRSVQKGALFVAVSGPNHDGHTFVAQAVRNGCVGVVVETGKRHLVPSGLAATVIEVEDTVAALSQMAWAHRHAPEIAGSLEVVAITGSSGKTSTKEFVAAILSAHCGGNQLVAKTPGNLNNHLGVPLTLLGLVPGQRFAVIELGMSARGEIAFLTSLCRPDVGVITNVGPAHLETLGTVEEVARAKGELFSALPDGATAVYLAGHALVAKQASIAGAFSGRLRAAVAAVGTVAEPSTNPVVSVTPRLQTAAGLQLDLTFPSPNGQGDGPAPDSKQATVPFLGVHHADNAALAVAAALALAVPVAAIVAGLACAKPAKHRGHLLQIEGRCVLDDCYNANPASMAAALRTLVSLRGTGRTVAVLGDMLELGPSCAAQHTAIGTLVASLGIDVLVTLGERAWHLHQAARTAQVTAFHVETPQQAASTVMHHTQPGDVVLLKASRGMALERVLLALQTFPSQGAG